jgi:predicted nucleic acid-binding protein
LPDAIASECESPTQEDLLNAGANLVSLTPEQVALVADFAVKYPGASTADLFALSYAKAEQHTLLTGDKKLRTAAKKENIATHGVLWMLDEMVSGGLLQKVDAIAALEAMRGSGAWLPEDECEKRLKEWNK